MKKDIVKLKEKLSNNFEAAKEELFQIKNKLHKSGGKMVRISKEKQRNAHQQVVDLQKETKRLKTELKDDVEDFVVERNAMLARKKADDAEAYYAACISLSFAAIEEAKIAMMNAVAAAEHAQKLEDESIIKPLDIL